MKLIKSAFTCTALFVALLVCSSNAMAARQWTVRVFVLDGIRYVLCCSEDECYIQDSYYTGE